jgi:hypothetical protein
MVRGRGRRFISRPRHTVGRGQVSTQPIFSHLWGSDWTLALNRQKIRVEAKRYTWLNSRSHRCTPVIEWGLVDYYVGPCSSRVQATWRKQSGSHEMIASAPGRSLTITGHCPHLEGGLSCKAPCSLWEVSVPCHKGIMDHSCLSLTPRWLQEGTGQSRGPQNGDRCQLFSSLVNSWSPVRSQMLKAV